MGMNLFMLAHDEQPIIAQSTPTGAGALALIRMTGTSVFDVAEKFIRFSSKNKISELSSHTIHYATIIDRNGTVVDRVMISILRQPKTFTGQDTVEISCHNNPFIIEKIIETAITHGARLAQEGEFTKRAYLNNKIDLIQAEAINEIIHAHSKDGLNKALEQLDGSFSAFIATIEKQLMHCLALCNASFEFLDEEVEFGATIFENLTEIKSQLTGIKKSFNSQQLVREGVRIAFIGTVNAGKSSLFNALLNKPRAIVTNLPGTTRDSIEYGIYRNSIYTTLVDTAGLRQTDDIIEQEGIARSHQEAQRADIILLILDGTQTLSKKEQETYTSIANQYHEKVVCISTKSDLASQHTTHELTIQIAVSSETKQNIQELENLIDKKISQLLQTNACPFLLNKRQLSLMCNLEQQIEKIITTMNPCFDYEIISFHLMEALSQLSELTGQTISKESMDAIFKSFCIGK
jgi:tRNA modification GTPase